MISNKRINIYLTEEEQKFIKWLAKRDNITFQHEMRIIFQLELEHEMELYKEEMMMEKEVE